VDQRTRDNWHKIKQVLEDAGKTDCYFYKRACKIVAGGRDPFDDRATDYPDPFNS
jgi:hypothetical protein